MAILLGPLKRSTEECRVILRQIQKYSNRLGVVPSSYHAWSGLLSIKRTLTKLCDDSRLVQKDQGSPPEEQCHMYAVLLQPILCAAS
jgi:hypothetical protein